MSEAVGIEYNNVKPNNEKWLTAARGLRVEQQRSNDIAERCFLHAQSFVIKIRVKEQKAQMVQLDKKIVQAQQKLRDTRVATSSAGTEVLMTRMREDAKMNRFLLTERLLKDINEKQQLVKSLKKIVTEPAMTDKDLEALTAELKEVIKDVEQLNQQLMQRQTPANDKLSALRQQAATLARKKEAAADRLTGSSEQVARLREELQTKQEMLKKMDSVKVLKGDEFKKYASQLRDKNTMFKKFKAEINALTTEFGILQRTEEVINHVIGSVISFS